MCDRAHPKPSRRSFLTGAAAALAAGATALPRAARAASLPFGTVRQLWIANSLTGEELRAYLTVDGKTVWRGNAQYPGYDQICWLLRDTHNGMVAAYDIRVLEAAWEIQQEVRGYGHYAPFLVTSGFRSPQTNTEVGGAPRSYHLRAAALDFVIPGADLESVWRIAASRQLVGGMGWYPVCRHIHIDSRPERVYWADKNPCA